MHPYRMQQLIKERGKGEVVNVRQRASIYQTIERLLRDARLRDRGRVPRRAAAHGALLVRSVAAELRDGRLGWTEEQLREFAAGAAAGPASASP